MRQVRAASGDRPWQEAAVATLGELAGIVRKCAKQVQKTADKEAVHDLRTATRRLRTAIAIYGADADKTERKGIEKELRRIAKRLGAVRDLDVLLEALAKASHSGAGRIDPDDVKPLREAWDEERQTGAGALLSELDRARFEEAVDGAERLLVPGHPGSDGGDSNGGNTQRIAHRAPGLIWDAAGKILAYELDPLTADPTAVHEMRIAAKKLRYTLEAFDEALEPGASLIATVTALQDAGGEMHDAIVARDRARAFADEHDLRDRQRDAVKAFADLQDRRAGDCRSTVATCLDRVRGRRFREDLGRAVAGMGHIYTAP
jgi:CHAD domain-containing protein